MKIKNVPIDKINPAPYNPRRDLSKKDKSYKDLEKSLNEFGNVEPLIWNKQTGNLVGGHQRLRILKDRGETEVEVSVVDLPLEKEKALNLALNKISGDWDNIKLGELMNTLNEDFRSLTGFGTDEIDSLLSSFDQVESTSKFFGDIEEEAEDEYNPANDVTKKVYFDDEKFDDEKFDDVDEGDYPNSNPTNLDSGNGIRNPDPIKQEVVKSVEFSCTISQRTIILDAINKAKEIFGVVTSQEALVAICEDFIEMED